MMPYSAGPRITGIGEVRCRPMQRGRRSVGRRPGPASRDGRRESWWEVSYWSGGRPVRMASVTRCRHASSCICRRLGRLPSRHDLGSPGAPLSSAVPASSSSRNQETSRQRRSPLSSSMASGAVLPASRQLRRLRLVAGRLRVEEHGNHRLLRLAARGEREQFRLDLARLLQLGVEQRCPIGLCALRSSPRWPRRPTRVPLRRCRPRLVERGDSLHHGNDVGALRVLVLQTVVLEEPPAQHFRHVLLADGLHALFARSPEDVEQFRLQPLAGLVAFVS